MMLFSSSSYSLRDIGGAIRLNSSSTLSLNFIDSLQDSGLYIAFHDDHLIEREHQDFIVDAGLCRNAIGASVRPVVTYREVMDDGAKERLADNITNAMAGVSEQVEQQVYEYWTNVDENLGARVRELFASKK